VIDGGGRVVAVHAIQGSAPFSVPVDQLPAGMYTARLTDATRTRTTRFLVAR